MSYKELIADIIMYSISRIELAEYDLNITREEVYEGEIKALTELLKHIEIILGGEEKEDIELCKKLVIEILEVWDEQKK